MAHTTASPAPTTAVEAAPLRFGALYEVCPPCGSTAVAVSLVWDAEGPYEILTPCAECCPWGRRGR